MTARGSYDLSLGASSFNLVLIAVAWLLLTHFGRKTILMAGCGILAAVLLTIGFLGIALKTQYVKGVNTTYTPNISWAIGIMLILYGPIYNTMMGPVCFALIPELSSGRLRVKTLAFARFVYVCCGTVCGIITPYQVNSTAWNWGPKTGFFWGSVSIMVTTAVYFLVPETKGRTYAELDVLFEMKVPARKFKSTEVDVFARSATEEENKNVVVF